MPIVPKVGDKIFSYYRTGVWLILKVRPILFNRTDLFYYDFNGIERKVWNRRNKNVGDVKEYKMTAKRIPFFEDSNKNFDEEDDRLYDDHIKEVITSETYDRIISEFEKKIEILKEIKTNER